MTNQLLKENELRDILQLLPDWDLKNSTLEKQFIFPNFIEAFGFMAKVAILAELIGHHPDWSNSYSKVSIKLTTHDLGGISNLDIKLAQEINKIK